MRLQWEHAQSEQAAVNYLVDQLHWFLPDNMLYWDDWGREPYPLNVIQGTILARREVMPPYPDVSRGEDTLQTHALLRAEALGGFRVSRLGGAGWCYIYRLQGATCSTPRITERSPRPSDCPRPAFCRVCPCCGSV
jgi:hypothetical protein